MIGGGERSSLHVKGCKGEGVLRRRPYSVKVKRQYGGGKGLSIIENSTAEKTKERVGQRQDGTL